MMAWTAARAPGDGESARAGSEGGEVTGSEHAMDPTEEQVFKVSGMTCQHCVAAVREEVGLLPGVRSVEVDLDSGDVVVHGEGV